MESHFRAVRLSKLDNNMPLTRTDDTPSAERFIVFWRESGVKLYCMVDKRIAHLTLAQAERVATALRAVRDSTLGVAWTDAPQGITIESVDPVRPDERGQDNGY